MMKKVVLSIIIFTFMVTGATFAQEFAKVGTAGAQFLKIGIGSRGIAMSNAYSAVANDASAIFWNPAGLTGIEENSLILSHADWLAGIAYEAAAYARTIQNVGTFGLSVSYLTSGDMEETTVEQQEGTGRIFSTNDLMVGLSYARQLSDKFSLGANIKYIREKLDTQDASAWAIDIGTLYYTGFNSLRLGMYIRNFGPELEISGWYNDYDNGSLILDPETLQPEQKEYLPFHMPMTFAVGIAYDININEDQKIVTGIDLVHPNDNVERFNVGAEYNLYNTLALRAGYVSPFGILGKHDDELENMGQDDEYGYEINNYTETFSAGLGFNLSIPNFGVIALDYAYSDFGVLDWVHRASMTVNF
ncbi:PorV/PorQ family protein [candidate division KSB1 bacterium]|nr:PorV/PorQ family protein [candidate division KSB1 bacterium]